MCNCVKRKAYGPVTLMAVTCDLVRNEEMGWYNGLLYAGCCFSGVFCVLYLVHGVQYGIEELCCPSHRYCGICLDEYCYEKTDHPATGFHSELTMAKVTLSDVSPLLVNRL